MRQALEPTLEGHVPRAPDRRRPWPVQSQLYVAVFGGPLALTAIASLNARRLGMPPGARRKLAAAGLGLGSLFGLLALATGTGIAVGLAGVATWYLLAGMQKKWDRIHQVFSDHEEPYGSLLGPGLLAAALLGWAPLALLLVATL